MQRPEELAQAEPPYAIGNLSSQVVAYKPEDYRAASTTMQASADSTLHGFPVIDTAGLQDSRESSPRDRLVDSLTNAGMGPEESARFQRHLTTFEANAQARGLSPEGVTETYNQLNRILEAGGSSVPANLRNQFVTQWVAKLADPQSVRQGWHDTCGMGFYQTYGLINHPDALTRTIADALVTGRTNVPDDSRSRIGMLFFDRPHSPTTTRPVQFDRSSFQPDIEAQGRSPHADARDYADQVAQVTLNTLKWDMREEGPGGWTTTQGRLRFRQCEDVRRPSDSTPSDRNSDRSCEAVEYTNRLGFRTVYDGNGYGFGGQSTISDIARVHFAITGRHDLLAIEGGGIRSQEDLETILQARQGHMPLGIFVTPHHPEFRRGYLDRHPELNEVPPNVMLHIVGVSSYNNDGTVDVFNPWGSRHRMTTRELYEAMRY